MEINDILTAREERRMIIKRLSADSPVVSVKANIPGIDKNTGVAYLVCAYFARLAREMGVYGISEYRGNDGRFFIGRVDDATAAKKALSEIEQEHPIGRFIDIDVTEQGSDRSISRGSMRKCFLCGEAAFVCARRLAHSTEELLDCFNKNIIRYFSKTIENLIAEAMKNELELTDKFGLVSPISNGSHTDLNYEIMLHAIGVIAPTLAECFGVGLLAEEPCGLLSRLRPIGISAEEKMLSVTGGSNAYKGFIFIGGALVAAAGYAVGRGLPFEEIYGVAAKICEDMDSVSPDTFGYRASRLGFGGIRAEAKAGFPTVNYARVGLNAGEKPLSVLASIVGKTEDSVLLKRAGDSYEYYRGLISTLDTGDRAELERVNLLCEQAGVSIGGSADILIAAFLMQKINNLFEWGELI